MNAQLRSKAGALFALALALVAGCLPGPENLTDGADLEVIVTGIKKNDVVHLDVGGVVGEAVADDDVISFFVEVGAGAHAGTIVIDRKDSHLCASFSVDVEAGERAVVGVDVDKDDACLDRTLIDFAEDVVGDCGNPSCESKTSVDEAGVVVVEANGNAVQGQARAQDHQALKLDAVSADADTLFAAGCEPQGAPPRETVVLTRTVVGDDGAPLSQSVDISQCRGGIAARLRAHVALLREDAGG